MIKVLSVASECAPFVKTGGLADVAGALPPALAAHDVDMRVLLPAYPQVKEAVGDAETVVDIPDCFGGHARLLAANAAGIELLMLDAPHLFDRGGSIYLDAEGRDWPDNAVRFAALSRVGADLGHGLWPDWAPDLLHCHDWQAGLTPYYIAKSGQHVPTVITIHNIAFQGLAPAATLDALGLDSADFHSEGLEYWGQLSSLKAGLVYADQITTVSPSYARELTTPEFGMGLEGVLQARSDRLTGILNGIDEAVWSPAGDPLVKTYKTPRGKRANKALLQAEFDLGESEGPLCVVVSRLTEQKGLDLLASALPDLIAAGGQLALLGSGDPTLERTFADAARRFPGQVGVRIGYDEALSHRMMAGADAILVPSRFEPCGLTQLYGLKYGTVPLVARTGGLADTVIDANPAALARGVATGIQFAPQTPDAFAAALRRLCDLFGQPKVWAQMQRNGMAQPVSWEVSAAAYATLYQDMIAGA